MSKTVSVIMAAYNAEKTVAESIDSILRQSFPDWEFIICDDGSTDRTWSILQEYAERYPGRIVAIQNEKNAKLPFSLNHCLQYATGEYVARMDADDRSYPERLEKQVAFLDAHPEIDVVGTGMTCFNDGEITGVRLPPVQPDTRIIGMGVPFFHATIMMKRSVYQALGGYSLESYVLRCEDVDLWMRFFGAGYRGANLQEPLYYVREDIAASKRRNLKGGINAARTLLYGYRRYHYPLKQYVFVLKPIISTLTPQKWKYRLNQKRWKKNAGDNGA